MTELMNMRKAKRLAGSLSACFLLVHIGLFLFFSRYQVTPMARFNIFSMLFYVATLLIIRTGSMRFYALAVYLEVVAHMTAAAYYTGWESGFQITLLGMSILLFYSEYVARYLKIPCMPSIPFCAFGALCYLATCAVCRAHRAEYPLPEDVVFWLQIGWGAMTFSITIYFLYTFVQLTSGSDELLSSKVNHDRLTGLPNRYFMADYLSELRDRSGLEGHWAAMLDIDDFKHINDTYGHNCGDYILDGVAGILRGSGMDMTVCRWGGEEFLLVGKVDGDLADVAKALDRLREAVVARPFQYEGQRLRVTVTVGLAEYRAGSDIRQWIGAADQRLYEGKGAGKNRVVV